MTFCSICSEICKIVNYYFVVFWLKERIPGTASFKANIPGDENSSGAGSCDSAYSGVSSVANSVLRKKCRVRLRFALFGIHRCLCLSNSAAKHLTNAFIDRSRLCPAAVGACAGLM